MPVSRTIRLAILSSAATIGLLTLAAPQVASAAAAPRTAHGAVSERTGYRAAPDAGVAAAGIATAIVSPSGCIQRADYPHKSTHRPGTADGVVTTKCNRHVPEIAQTAQMWETRWWGWDRIGTKGVVSRFEVAIVSSTAWDWCKKNTVRVTGSGHVIDIDRHWYYASTVSISVKNPCGL
jgi:hypothetical protein